MSYQPNARKSICSNPYLAPVNRSALLAAMPVATAARRRPKTVKNSFQKVCFSAASEALAAWARRSSMARLRISFQES